MPLKTILFDLDGTLADTAPDLAHILNRLLTEENKTELPFETIRPHVSHGSQALIKLGFGLQAGDEGFEALRQRFLNHYRDNICRHTVLFPGMEKVLQHIENRNLSWGVVTNKPAYLTDPLMQALGLDKQARCIVSGDTTANNKPHPGPMLHACKLSGAQPGECLYIGDAERDIIAGREAGMSTLVARYGYIEPGHDPESWGADGMIDTPEDIMIWIDKYANDSE